MIATARVTLFQNVVKITEEYLGPAAERFVIRQIQTHLHKEPTDLTEKDIPQLVDWIKIAIALLTEDKKLVEDFANSLLQMSNRRT